MSSTTQDGPTPTSDKSGWECETFCNSCGTLGCGEICVSTDPTADSTGWIEVWDSNDYADEQAVFRFYCSGLFQQRGHL